MNCRDVKKLLIPYLDSELSENTKIVVESHLHDCKECQKERQLLEQTWSVLDGIQTPEMSSNFTQKLMAKIHDQEERKPLFNFDFPEINFQFNLRTVAPVFASFCLFFIVYLILQNRFAQDQQLVKDIIIEQYPIMINEKSTLNKERVDIAKSIPSKIKDDFAIDIAELVNMETNENKMDETIESIEIETTQLNEDEAFKIVAIDAEIIQNLDIYENIEFYQNYALIEDLDIVEHLNEGIL